jgi:vacuolar-type H+-ATPase subunit F/Vma7
MQKWNTSCKHCTFKTTIKTKTGLVQTGCQLDRINKFKEKGVTVELQKDALTEAKSFLIKGRFCTTLRHNSWRAQHKDPIRAVRKEVELQCAVIILVNSAKENLTDTLETVITQKLLPKIVRVVINTDKVDMVKTYELLEKMIPEGIQFYADYIHLPDYKYGKLIDVAADKIVENPDNGAVYYAVFNAGFKIPPTFISDVDHAINDKLEVICALEPDADDNGLVVEGKLHKLLCGNKEVVLEKYENGELLGSFIIDKAKFMAETSDPPCLHTIKKVREVCKEM